jgi:hypothetical protein
MKLLLHIGTEKTGTTSLQHWLHRSDTQLRSSGVWFARCLKRPDNRWIAVVARDGNDPDDGFIDAAIDDPEAHTAFASRIAQELKTEVEDAQALGCRIFLISSEHLHSRLDRRSLKRLHGFLAPLFQEIEVLCYVRPQAELLQSRLSVAVRHMTIGSQFFDKLGKRSYFDYHALWKRWSSTFDKVTFAPWKRNPDVVRDVCNRLGLNPELFPQPIRRNKALGYETALLAHNIGASEAGRKASQLLQTINLDDLPKSKPLRLPRELAEKANSLYRKSNEELTRDCPYLTLADLEVDPRDFPVQGNVYEAVHRWDAAEQLGCLVVRLSVQLELERARTEIAKADRALAMKRPDNALQFLGAARSHIAAVRQADLDQLRKDAATLLLDVANLEAGAKRFGENPREGKPQGGAAPQG